MITSVSWVSAASPRSPPGSIRSLPPEVPPMWNGQYSIFGYHPNIGKSFRDDEGPDFASAVHDMKERGHECLRVHWKPTGTNWTTVNDEGVAECSWGMKLG